MSWHVRNRYLAPQASWLKGAAGEAFGEFGPFCASEHGPDHGDGRPSPPGDGLGRGDGQNEGSGTSAGRRCRPPPGYSWWPGRAAEAGIKRIWWRSRPLVVGCDPVPPSSVLSDHLLPRSCVFWLFLANVTVG